jgi:hypothetical protein
MTIEISAHPALSRTMQGGDMRLAVRPCPSTWCRCGGDEAARERALNSAVASERR